MIDSDGELCRCRVIRRRHGPTTTTALDSRSVALELIRKTGWLLHPIHSSSQQNVHGISQTLNSHSIDSVHTESCYIPPPTTTYEIIRVRSLQKLQRTEREVSQINEGAEHSVSDKFGTVDHQLHWQQDRLAETMDWQDNYDLRNSQPFGRDDIIHILPWIDGAENEAAARPARRPSSPFYLLILSMFLPYEIVRDVEQTVGWPDFPFGGQTPRINLANFRELRRVVQALRYIRRRTCTLDVQYLMQNLQDYKTLLGRLLDDLIHCRRTSSPRSVRALSLPGRGRNEIPEADENDLIRHANALEVLLDELDRIESISGFPSLILLDQFDEHIFTVHRLIEFLIE